MRLFWLTFASIDVSCFPFVDRKRKSQIFRSKLAQWKTSKTLTINKINPPQQSPFTLIFFRLYFVPFVNEYGLSELSSASTNKIHSRIFWIFSNISDVQIVFVSYFVVVLCSIMFILLLCLVGWNYLSIVRRTIWITKWFCCEFGENCSLHEYECSLFYRYLSMRIFWKSPYHNHNETNESNKILTIISLFI